MWGRRSNHLSSLEHLSQQSFFPLLFCLCDATNGSGFRCRYCCIKTQQAVTFTLMFLLPVYVKFILYYQRYDLHILMLYYVQ